MSMKTHRTRYVWRTTKTPLGFILTRVVLIAEHEETRSATIDTGCGRLVVPWEELSSTAGRAADKAEGHLRDMEAAEVATESPYGTRFAKAVTA
jgi:hypothetical protein